MPRLPPLPRTWESPSRSVIGRLAAAFRAPQAMGSMRPFKQHKAPRQRGRVPSLAWTARISPTTAPSNDRPPGGRFLWRIRDHCRPGCVRPRLALGAALRWHRDPCPLRLRDAGCSRALGRQYLPARSRPSRCCRGAQRSSQDGRDPEP
jgi:hypothetical protein